MAKMGSRFGAHRSWFAIVQLKWHPKIKKFKTNARFKVPYSSVHEE
jgi:hypothetical protein